MSDPADFTITEAATALRSEELTAVELLAAVRRRAAMTEARSSTAVRSSERRAVAAWAIVRSAGSLIRPPEGREP